MQLLTIPFILLIVSTLLVLFVLFYCLTQKSGKQIQKLFSIVLICVLIICIGVLLQAILSYKFGINPILFEGYIYIGTCFLPVALFFVARAFVNTKITFSVKHLLLFIIPITTILIVFNNSPLFYKHYSSNLNEMAYGNYFLVHIAYTYGLFLISIILMLKYSAKNAGFFSRQSVSIIIGTMIPIVVNILGMLRLLNMNVYLTPISFSITMLFFALAIFKFKFLNVVPIALQKIVDRISDGYIVIDENHIIIDFNKPFLEIFSLNGNNIRNKKLFDLISERSDIKIKIEVLSDILKKTEKTSETFEIQKHFDSINKYFNIEINSITSKNSFLGTLILFKDVTQHKLDLQEIKEKQDIIIERDRLASLGQLIGGISHNLKTPIMSISGATEGLLDLIKEYEDSVGVDSVTIEDHHDIAKDMKSWIEKIRLHVSYMSDIITTVKGQAVNLNTDANIGFTLDELVKRVDILMKHELKNALINFNVIFEASKDIKLNGDITSLVQVINNLITNSIQAYNGETGKDIDLSIVEDNNNIIIAVKDYACGIPKEIQKTLFKEMITTKGKNGTGLGLYMSYSNIKGKFNGTMTFESEENVGTTFYMSIPIN